jgi:hypothetical protein
MMRSFFRSGLMLLGIALSVTAQYAEKYPEYKLYEETNPPNWCPVPEDPDQAICFCLYTVQDGVLKMTAQLYPLVVVYGGEEYPETVRLEVQRDGEWQEVDRTEIVRPGWTAPFRVEEWDHTQDVPYRVLHGDGAVYTGLIRRDPVDKSQIVVAGFTGNSNGDRRMKPDIIRNLKAIDPDLLFFSGDQSYDHKAHLWAWLLFGKEFGDVIRDRPTVTIPDDHDIGQGNLWGAGGGRASTSAGNDGGYFYPVEYVQEVERAQTGHLPDPYDPRPIEGGIGVYFTSLRVGGVDFAVIEDRKFKSGPKGLVPEQGPRPDHILNPDYDPQSVDVQGAVLLGDRQLHFLHDWGQDWRDVEMKAVLSQTVFCNAAHLHGGASNRLHADMDSNGWPQSGRNRAIREMRRCFAFHLAGDQHLGTVIHHGIDDWGDSIYSFCVPSIVNYYLRWWIPEVPGGNRPPGPLAYTGDFYDGFHNRITMLAYANPDHAETGWRSPRYPDELNPNREWGAHAPGFGIVRFDKQDRTIRIECWPRGVDVTSEDAKPYPGWPVTVQQLDNYAREADGFLPMVKVEGCPRPVIQVQDERTGEILYTVRVPSPQWQPKVFDADSVYTVRVGADELTHTIPSVRVVQENQTPSVISVDLTTD